jgi:hypothetical protein
MKILVIMERRVMALEPYGAVRLKDVVAELRRLNALPQKN